jgi:hypothetical protein
VHPLVRPRRPEAHALRAEAGPVRRPRVLVQPRDGQRVQLPGLPDRLHLHLGRLVPVQQGVRRRHLLAHPAAHRPAPLRRQGVRRQHRDQVLQPAELRRRLPHGRVDRLERLLPSRATRARSRAAAPSPTSPSRAATRARTSPRRATATNRAGSTATNLRRRRRAALPQCRLAPPTAASSAARSQNRPCNVHACPRRLQRQGAPAPAPPACPAASATCRAPLACGPSTTRWPPWERATTSSMTRSPTTPTLPTSPPIPHHTAPHLLPHGRCTNLQFDCLPPCMTVASSPT